MSHITSTDNYEEKKWILRHCDLDLQPKVANFNGVQANAVIKSRPNRCFRSAGMLLTDGQIDRHTRTHKLYDFLGGEKNNNREMQYQTGPM